ncbi:MULTISPECIES: S24 family peptidase [unclassified Shewanella]|uniref:S24 family peptidase n=1 Tax=unclassified Shewanella TaxID=196818 RepID=UPI0021DB1766|nr:MULTISPECIES: S24 family peptidase [unclassified Shewanella]
MTPYQNENQATFKQLIIDGNKKYLKALNPDWPNKFVEINGNCTIVGKVVFTGKAL